MEDKSLNHNAELSARERWRNLWNALSEETLVEKDVSYPEAEQVKHTLLQSVARDARAQLTPSEVSRALEQTGRAVTDGPGRPHWPEPQKPEPGLGSKTHGREVEPEQDIDPER